MHRILSAGLLSLALLGAGGFGTDALAGGAGQNAAFLVIEKPDEAVEQIRRTPALMAQALAASESTTVPKEALAAAEQAVADSYPAAPMLDELHEALASLPDAPSAEALSETAKRFADTASVIDAEADENPEAVAQSFQDRLGARPDKATITELASLMAAPELRGEVALAALRLQRVLALAEPNTAKEFSALPPAERAAQIGQLVTDTRDETQEPDEPLSRARGVAEGKGLVEARLVLLSPEDVSVLHAFYASEQGRAKRDALVSAFAARNDTNARRMVEEFAQKLTPAR